MVSHRSHRYPLALIALVAAGAHAAPSMPNEFENAPDALSRMFAYFGGVASWGTVVSSHRVHSGNSLKIDCAFRPDPNFVLAGFAVGSFGTATPDLNIAPGADTFSVSIQAPPAGTLSFTVSIREDDNNNGVINAGEGDDQWETDPIMIEPGTRVYNIPLSQFLLANPGTGNGVQNFTTTSRMGYFFTFETRQSYPGGQITTPVTFYIDHAGFYVGAQSLPPTLPGDLNGDGVVNFTDLNIVLSNFGASGTPGAQPGDANGDGLVNFTDLNIVLSSFGQSA